MPSPSACSVWLVGFLAMCRFGPAMPTIHSSSCVQAFPIEVIGNSGKTIVSEQLCGARVFQHELMSPPGINVRNLSSNATYSLFLLKDLINGQDYKIMWQLGHVKPNGSNSLTYNKTSSHVLTSYNQPLNVEANYTILVYKENNSSANVSVSSSNVHHFNPRYWASETSLQQITNTTFRIFHETINPTREPPIVTTRQPTIGPTVTTQKPSHTNHTAKPHKSSAAQHLITFPVISLVFAYLVRAFLF